MSRGLLATPAGPCVRVRAISSSPIFHPSLPLINFNYLCVLELRVCSYVCVCEFDWVECRLYPLTL